MTRLLAILTILQVFAVAGFPQSLAGLKIADFRKTKAESNIGTDFGTWDRDPADPTQTCQMKFSNEDASADPKGHSIRLEYDVDSPRPAYNGFWLKIDRRRAADFISLSLAVRGDSDAGFPETVKIEIKVVGGKSLVQYIRGISSEWKNFDISLRPLAEIGGELTELTIVFEDTVSRPKRGAIFIDDIILKR
jgi:hypothetical protein